MPLFDSRRKEPAPFDIKGGTLKCLICGHETFTRRKAQLNTAAMSFMNLDWANKSATCAICESCGYLHWFLID